MKKLIRWGLAAGLAAALGLYTGAQAQGASGSSGAGGSRGDTGGPTPSGKDRSSADSQTTPQGGAAGTSSDSGARGSTGSSASGSGASGSGAASGGTASSGRSSSGQQGKIDEDLKERLERIHADNQAEVQLSKLGAQNAQDPRVKQFAEQMGTDHERADQKLTQTAQSAGVTSLQGETFKKESDKAKKDMEKLQSKTGAEFDKEYMSHMVKDHEKGVKEVEKAAKDAKKANQTELASMLEQTHTGMKAHLEHAKQLEKSLKSSDQRQGRRPPGATGGMGSGSAGGSSGAGGSRGDTGGPSPTGQDRSSSGTQNTPSGGAAGSSSDSGQRTTK